MIFLVVRSVLELVWDCFEGFGGPGTAIQVLCERPYAFQGAAFGLSKVDSNIQRFDGLTGSAGKSHRAAELITATP